MLKPSGNFSLAVGSLSTAVAIGSAGTGANFASAAVLGAPCIQEGGVAGACAEGAGAGLVNGCDPGPAPGGGGRAGPGGGGGGAARVNAWARGPAPGGAGGGPGVWGGREGWPAGCRAHAGAGGGTPPAQTAANNRLREPDRMEFMAIS